MAHQRGPGRAVAGDDIDNTFGKDPLAQFAEPQTGKRRLLRALDNHAVAGRERRSSLFGAKAEWMIERVDHGYDAVGLAPRQDYMAWTLRRCLAFNLGDEPRE